MTKKHLYIKILFATILGCTIAFADKTWSLNKKAMELYKKGNYEEALKLLNDAELEAPNDLPLKMNKGSTLFKSGKFDKAEEEYKSATSMQSKSTLADLYYNLGNTNFIQAEQLAQSGKENAQEKYKEAIDNYIKALDIHSSDKDTKWNLQLAQMRMKQNKEQQKNDQNKDKKDDKDKKNQKNDKNDESKKDDKNKQDQDKQDQDNKNNQSDKKDQQKQDQQKQDEQNKDGQKPEDKQNAATPQDKKEEMKKEEAKRLIAQFSDDADQLNKPHKKVLMQGNNPEKDW